MPFYDINNRNYQIIFFIFALFEVLLCSGITYGWASILIVFKLEKFNFDMCKEWIGEHNIIEALSADKLPGCPEQEGRMNLIFTVAVFSVCAVTFPGGIVIDKFGPTAVRIIGRYVYFVLLFIFYHKYRIKLPNKRFLFK